MSQYYESSNYISNLFFVMPYTYVLDESIKSPTLILTADHSTLLFLPVFFFYKTKNFFFLTWVNLYIITDPYCMTLPLLTDHFSWPFPFLRSQKIVTLPLFPPPLPLLISDKSLRRKYFKTLLRPKSIQPQISPKNTPYIIKWKAMRSDKMINKERML